MHKQTKLYLVFMVVFTLSLQRSNGCTTLSIHSKESTFVGKSYDFTTSIGMAIVNPRNLKKSAFILNNQKPAEWTSKYGSVTFNQWGREMPVSGMNEKGLVVEVMWLQDTVYPLFPKKPTINELQWIQYQLDNFSTIDEIIQKAEDISIQQALAWLHYMACDRTGACATLENLNGKMTIHKNLPYNALTNETYSNSTAILPLYQEFGGILPIPRDSSPYSRFIRAANLTKKFNVNEHDPKTYLQEALNNVYDRILTVWQIIHDTRGDIQFRQTRGDTTVLKFDLSKIDFSCRTQVKAWDLLGNIFGDRLQHDYYARTNEELVALAYKKMVFSGIMISPNEVDRLGKYPETLKCME